MVSHAVVEGKLPEAVARNNWDGGAQAGAPGGEAGLPAAAQVVVQEHVAADLPPLQRPSAQVDLCVEQAIVRRNLKHGLRLAPQ